MRAAKWLASLAIVGLSTGALAQQSPIYNPQPLNGQTAATVQFFARGYGCVWDGAAGNDVGPCINLAIAAATSNGGGEVVLPCGTFYIATEIVKNVSGVHLKGCGVGIPRDTASPAGFIASTTLKWNGIAGAGPALDIEPTGGATQYLYSADVDGIAVDCGSLLDTCVIIRQVSSGIIRLGQAEARKTGILFTTNNIDGSGNQQLDVWLQARNLDSNYSATGIVLDNGPGSSYNTSYSRFHQLYAAYGSGDGIVLGNADTNVIDWIGAFHYGSSTTGSPFVCANSVYSPPSGVAVNGRCYDNVINLLGASGYFAGFSNGLTFTASGGNAGTAALNPITLTTNATSAAGTYVLIFASTSGLVAGESVNCGGFSSGVAPYSPIISLTATQVTIKDALAGGGGLSGVASGQSCTFSIAATSQAAAGTYTLSYNGATYDLAAPSGGNSQSGVSPSGGVLTFSDLVIPLTGTPVSGDSWTIVVPTPSGLNVVNFVDKANSHADPAFGPGATGTAPYGTGREKMSFTTQSSGVGIGSSDGTFSSSSIPKATGRNSAAIGGASIASGPYSSALAGSGNAASGFYSTNVGGTNNAASGIASGILGGQNATDRGNYNTQAWASGQFSAKGDAQETRHLLRGSGTTASAFRLTADAASAGAANCVNIPNNTAYQLVIDVLAFDHTTVSKNEEWSSWSGLLTRGANAAATSLLMNSTPTPQTNGTLTGSAISASADTTQGCVNISFTPPTGNTDTWRAIARVQALEVQ